MQNFGGISESAKSGETSQTCNKKNEIRIRWLFWQLLWNALTYTWIFQVRKICAFLPQKPTKRQKFYIFGRSRYTWNPKQPVLDGCLVISNHFPFVKVWFIIQLKQPF